MYCTKLNKQMKFTWIDVSPLQITNCDLGLINDGRLADCFPCLKIREIRFVLVSKAAYTTVKQNPAPNLQWLSDFLFAILLYIFKLFSNLFHNEKCKTFLCVSLISSAFLSYINSCSLYTHNYLRPIKIFYTKWR